MRNRTIVDKWKRRRQRAAERQERIKKLKAEIARTHFSIGRLDPQTEHKQIVALTRTLRNLEQRLRYISSFDV